MKARTKLRWWGVVACAALATTASADATYLQLPGVTGPSTATRYGGWFDVAQETVVLVPGVYDAARKATQSSCSAVLRTRLGAAGATVAQLVGGTIGTVKVERVNSSGARYYQAVLRNAVLTQQIMSFENGAESETLFFRFEAADVTTYDLKPDGSRGSGTQGSFNCLVGP